MGGSTATLTQAEPRLSNIRVQTSSQGLTIPKGWGRYRVGCNLLWYGNFKAIEHKSVQEQGGKGGGGGVRTESITYTYEAAIIICLGHGDVLGVVSAWKGKERLQGEDVPARKGRRRHTFTMPDLGGDFQYRWSNTAGSGTHIVTLPLAVGETFSALILVERGTKVNTLKTTWKALREGVEYTRAGHVLTINSRAPAGQYQVTYEVVEVAAYWKSALGQLNLTLQPGTIDQPVWPWLAANYPAEALAYPGLAICYSQAYALTSAAELYNHNFEVSTGSELGEVPGLAEPVYDADPREFIEEVVADQSWGVGWLLSKVQGLDRYSDYCVANGFWLSPVLEEQTTAAELLEGTLKLTNTDIVYDGDELTFVPLGDEDVSAHGRTFVADVTPLVDLTEDHFLSEPGQSDLRMTRHMGQDGGTELTSGDDVGYNIWTLEIENRANGYNTEPVSYEDTAHIMMHGRRQKPTIKARAIKDPALGVRIATLLCQRELSGRNVYECTLPWTLGFLKPLDLVTISHEAWGISRKAVRLLTVDEANDDGDLAVTMRSCDIGMASAPAYGSQVSAGFEQDYNAAPGSVVAPVIFEPPVQLAPETGLAVWIAVTGSAALWGGAEVWASMDDGVTYKRVGEVTGGARYGSLAASMAAGGAATMDVQLAGRGGQILSATELDAQSLASLMYVAPAGAVAGEFLAYESAVLSGANRYTLGGLVRGGYMTADVAHASAAAVVRVDDLIVKSEPMPLSMIGKVVKFKFLSFNVFRAGLQALEDVAEYAYAVTGAMVRLPPSDVSSISAEIEGFGVRLRWPEISDGDRADYELRRDGASWDDALPLTIKASNSHLWAVQSAGTHRVRIKARDALGNYSRNETVTDVVITAPAAVALSAVIDGPDIVLSWPEGTAAFAIDHYELRYGDTFEAATFLAAPLSTSYRMRVGWGGARTFWAVVVDVAGNVGTPSSVDVTITSPGPVQAVRSEVVDNNALLYWSKPVVGSLPVERYEVRKGASFAGGVVVGSNGNSTFTTIFEQQAGAYSYWVAPYDSAGNTGTAVAIPATIQQPPDYVLRTDFNSGLAGALSNMYLDGGAVYGPVNTSESWATHFSSHGWASPQAQIDAGMPIYVNPSLTTGSYVEELDYGSVLPSTIVTVTPVTTVLQGTVTLSCQIAYKVAAGDPWTDAAAGLLQVLVSSFRYVRVTLTFTCSAGANLLVLQGLNIKLANKLRTDSGKGTASASDVGGTVVSFAVPFIDADTPIVQPAGTSPRFAVVDFVDAPNPTSFKVLLYDISGTRVSGDFSWTARGY